MIVGHRQMYVDGVALRRKGVKPGPGTAGGYSVGAPDGRLTTPMSFMNTPRLKPVPTAFEKASLAAKRLARVPAMVNGRRAALARSISVKTRSRNLSPQRSSDFWIRSMLHRSEPMPTIISPLQLREGAAAGCGVPGRHRTITAPLLQPASGPRYAGRGACLTARSSISARIRRHAVAEAGENRLADQEMADVELGELRDGGDRRDIVEGQAVAGVGLDAVLDGQRGAIGDALQFGRVLLALDMGVAAGVELDHRRAEPNRGLDLSLARLDEQADADARVAEPVDIMGAAARCWPAASSPPSVVRSSRFSGTMQAAWGWWAKRDRQHLLGRRHLEIQRQIDLGHQPVDVAGR